MWGVDKKIGFAVIGLFASLVFLAYHTEQSAFAELLIGITIAFIGLAYLYKNINSVAEVNLVIGAAIAVRLCLLFAFPLLSDDIYRFIWDGRLLVAGENPFEQLPSYWTTNGGEAMALTKSLYNELNSPNYFTIYPPVCQAIFACSQWIAGSSIFGAALVMKLFIVGFEIGSILLMLQLLKSLKIPTKNIMLYALNPLIILEISGNLHFEGPMIFFLLLALNLIVKNKWKLSALALAFSVASKLLPLLFLPFIWNYLGLKKGFLYCLFTGVFCLLLFAPLFSPVFIANFADSLDLYFQKFEFNGSIYYLGRWLGEIRKGYNIIQTLGPSLAMLTFTSVLFLAFRKRITSVQQLLSGCFWAFCIYLFLGTTIHPWYLSIPILLSVFLPFRFPIFWSFLIMLTYINYSQAIYDENLWIVALEYIVVIAILSWEVFTFFRGKMSHPPEQGIVH